ncbi:MAG: Tfp pilus assembly protein FimT/FimU [Halioglobus sp.]
MKVDASKGFTLIELLVVLSIIGLATITVYLIPTDLGETNSIREIKQLEKHLKWNRWQAIQAGLPRKLVQSGRSLLTRQWSQSTGGWVKPSDQTMRSTFSANFSIQIENLSDTNSGIFPMTDSVNEVFANGNEQSLIFWPDGTSNGGRVILSSNLEETQYISVTPMGSMNSQ